MSIICVDLVSIFALASKIGESACFNVGVSYPAHFGQAFVQKKNKKYEFLHNYQKKRRLECDDFNDFLSLFFVAHHLILAKSHCHTQGEIDQKTLRGWCCDTQKSVQNSAQVQFQYNIKIYHSTAPFLDHRQPFPQTGDLDVDWVYTLSALLATPQSLHPDT